MRKCFGQKAQQRQEPDGKKDLGSGDLQGHSLSVRGTECETGRPAGSQRGCQGALCRAPALGQGSPSTQITYQPCLGQPDTPAHRHQEHSPGRPPLGQGAVDHPCRLQPVAPLPWPPPAEQTSWHQEAEHLG